MKTREITISDLLNMAENGINTFSVKDNSPRGCKTISASMVKVGDKVVIDNYFHLVVDDPAEEIPEDVKKLEALKAHLINCENFTEEEAAEAEFDSRFNCFTCGSWEYKVFTEDEADEAVKADILGSLWAFNPDFILRHTAFYQQSTEDEDDAFIESLENLQCNICEGANAIVKALIEDMDAFVSDAVDADGRGHFLATYDGEELEVGDFFAYRIN